MHVAKIRYQRDVRTEAGVLLPARSAATAGSAMTAAGTTARLKTMRQAVRATWENAESALTGLGADAEDLGPFAADRDLARWLDRQLQRDIELADVQYEEARTMTEATPEPSAHPPAAATPTRPAPTARSTPTARPTSPPQPTSATAQPTKAARPASATGQPTPTERPAPGAHPASVASEPIPAAQSASVARSARPGDPDRPPLRFLAVADEWFPARGGLSAFNRYLCRALADAGAEVACVVPRSSRSERDDADEAGVRLVDAPAAAGLSERERLIRRPALPGGIAPDVVIGHGRVTGDVAKVIAEDHFPESRRLHFVHMDPREVEWHKLDRRDDAGMRAEERGRLEMELAQGAAALVAVGPRLHEWLDREPPSRRPPLLLRLDPGFDGPAPADRSGPPGGRPQILVLGRMEDLRIKGLDVAARGIADAVRLMSAGTEWDLLVRGAPPDGSGPLRESLLDWLGNTPVNVTAYPYSPDFGRIQDDLHRSSLVLMPSRAEGFGLVGLEAIVAATPVLVSDRSGLGGLLRDVLPREVADRVVVPVTRDEEENARRWGNLISSVMRDRTAAFGTVETVRRAMAQARPWSRAAGALMDAVRPLAESR